MMHVLRVGAGSEALRTRCLLLLRLLRDKLFAADGHAEQPPCGERPHERAGVRVVRPKRVGDELLPSPFSLLLAASWKLVYSDRET